jgi:hypothetical protein
MKKYIPTLMEIYQDMEKENDKAKVMYEKWKKQNPSKSYWQYEEKITPYSSTMLKYIITIIHKMSNE